MHVSALYCYPVKSAYGISLSDARVGPMGILYDRRWAVIDEKGMFVAQRSDRGLGIGIKSMCLVKTAIQGEFLVLTAPKMPQLILPLAGYHSGVRREVQVWQDVVTGQDQGQVAQVWFTQFLSRERPGTYYLVRMPDDGLRQDKEHHSRLAFADGYSLLGIAQASLDDLNARMAVALPMNRFRPGIVIGGCEPYVEDHIALFQVNDLIFRGETLCVRCPITTTDQATAVRGKEPLRTLATYRRTEHGVVFGRNFSHKDVGTIAVGDEIKVLAWD